MMAGQVKKSRLFSALSDVLRRPSMRHVVRFFTDAHVQLYRATGGKAQVAEYPTWWLNLREAKEAEIQVMRTKLRVHAEVATPEERATFWPELVAMYRYFVDYQQRTQREIPVIVLRPVGHP
jgi:deazaflavin-dependent oxidoreductase (nitroreductase family)